MEESIANVFLQNFANLFINLQDMVWIIEEHTYQLIFVIQE